MNTKMTLLLLALAGGLFGFIQLYEMKQPTTREAAARGQYVLLFDRNNINGISITSNEEQIELRKRGSRWEIEAPIKDRADQAAVEEMLAQCERLRQEASIGGKSADKRKLKDLGVAKSNLRLKLLGQDAPPELWFGKETAVEGKTYARLEGSNSVSIVSNELKNLLSRKADELRDRRLADFDASRVTGLSLKTPTGEIALEKERDHWGLNKPLKARADEATINRLLSDFLGSQIVAFLPSKDANLNSYGLSEPRGRLTLQTLTYDQPIMLDLGAADEKTGNIYARISDREAVFLVAKQFEKLLTLKPNELRDRRLLRVNMDSVDRVSIVAEGKPPVVLQRKLEQWVELDREAKTTRPANGEKIQAMVTALQSRQISAFVADVTSDLAKYGLDHPKLRLTFSSYASENTAESDAGERPLVSVLFGNTDDGNVYARVENEPFVVSVDKSLLEAISADPVEWRALSVFQFKPGEVEALDITSYADGIPRPTISLVRKNGEWAAGEGSAPGTVNQINIQSLVNTLATLGAVRWTGSSEAITPSQTITFKTTSRATRKLIMGPSAEDKTCAARVDGDPGVFTISSPDNSGLRLDLMAP